ncbi:MAG: glutamate--tRNA ligase [Candidatus Magasanikbacteria bacterium RIFCSPLOWO2_01_FULL_43_20b]|uniref:Glutamate--tRNA ligase n=1 Tax=Candidatus Magasanikbacteria bacterium RIFCSPLOWO2_12_FULL_43_12 TaxID=1798692 RepID=A0A1F6MR43_9BACT|nr:MAG: glutamate--tRNA ligase [Candidatus Magasanikbacteria bacterium RIFCSPHIGHO2_02_FULL_44_13]OGH73146.1 MAG: glutamate--tRNA ligase [Candidatus Magasanikbacteria bacterium RIFCSPLOWO2_01_FULL_43_20b]OGH74129.1 MAG: glutamate--tRNA ligase [Candidatus Magasanikbacteria bacterium RIFCSPLOWO2_12_FULL_43_12]
MVKTRFAPSPTGFLHVGGLRTALFSYLFAKHHGGKFLLRIEDTDRERLVDGGIENILKSLRWAGIKPDEGIDLDESGKVIQTGKNGPYIQSERLKIYHKHVDRLIKDDHAYYCFCSKERLAELRQIQEANKQATGYDGLCREMPLAEAKKRVTAGESHVIRMKMPKTGITKFTDLVRGDVEFKNELIDDQVILKADRFPTYHLAVVVDDHLMEITHVIRAEEWLPSTPKHIELYKMFGWKPPEFAHLSLLVNEQKQKLSKRHGDVAVRDFIDKGYLPEAMVNFIAFLGWNPGDEREMFDLDSLIKEFDFAKISKAAGVFNLEKLDWFNREYLKKMPSAELIKICLPMFRDRRYEIGDNDWLGKVLSLEKKRVTTLVELVESIKFVFEDTPYEAQILVWKKSSKEETKNVLEKLVNCLNKISVQDWTKTGMESRVGGWMKENEFGTGNVLWPMRVALSGQKNSPGPFEIAEVLGKEETIERLRMAIKKLE